MYGNDVMVGVETLFQVFFRPSKISLDILARPLSCSLIIYNLDSQVSHHYAVGKTIVCVHQSIGGITRSQKLVKASEASFGPDSRMFVNKYGPTWSSIVVLFLLYHTPVN